MSGASNAANRAIAYTKECGILVRCTTTPTNERISNGECERLARALDERNIGLNVNLPCPLGRFGDRFEEMLTDENLQALANLCKRFGISPDIDTG